MQESENKEFYLLRTGLRGDVADECKQGDQLDNCVDRHDRGLDLKGLHCSETTSGKNRRTL